MTPEKIQHPDALAIFTPTDPNPITADNLVLVFEVVSADFDRIEKLREYQAAAAIQRYVVLVWKRICAVAFTRVQAPNPLHAILVEYNIRRNDQHGLHQALWAISIRSKESR